MFCNFNGFPPILVNFHSFRSIFLSFSISFIQLQSILISVSISLTWSKTQELIDNQKLAVRKSPNKSRHRSRYHWAVIGGCKTYGGRKTHQRTRSPEIFWTPQKGFWSALSWIFVQEKQSTHTWDVPYEGGPQPLFGRGVIREVFHPPFFSTPPRRPVKSVTEINSGRIEIGNGNSCDKRQDVIGPEKW